MIKRTNKSLRPCLARISLTKYFTLICIKSHNTYTLILKERRLHLQSAAQNGRFLRLGPRLFHDGPQTVPSCDGGVCAYARRWNYIQGNAPCELVMHAQLSHFRYRGKVLVRHCIKYCSLVPNHPVCSTRPFLISRYTYMGILY